MQTQIYEDISHEKKIFYMREKKLNLNNITK